MEQVNSILLVIQVLLSISLIALILLQHGKGADAGAAFGSGASATVFGARGSGNFLSRATTVVALLFFIVCLSLAYISANREAPDGVSGSVTVQQPGTSPAMPEGSMTDSDLPSAGGLEGDASPTDLPPAE